tara:strand:+ start:552 stop:1025 length:474 start_codon:yes stop_codon:yes gene_type:complete
MYVTCPNCRNKFKAKKRVQPVSEYEIAKMMEDKDKKYKELVKQIIDRIRRNIPSENKKQSIYNFIEKISNYPILTISRAYNMYITKGYFWQSKGFNYFMKMVETVDEDWVKYEDNQKKKFGTSPKTIEWNKNDKSKNSKSKSSKKETNSRRSKSVNR